MSSTRPSIQRSPSSSRCPVSPVAYQPSRIVRVRVGPVPVAREGLVGGELTPISSSAQQAEPRVHPGAPGAARLRAAGRARSSRCRSRSSRSGSRTPGRKGLDAASTSDDVIARASIPERSTDETSARRAPHGGPDRGTASARGRARSADGLDGRRASAPSHRGCDDEAPTDEVPRAANGCPSCDRWASRRASVRRAVGCARVRHPAARSAACERGTPFGRPVVPLVYSISGLALVAAVRPGLRAASRSAGTAPRRRRARRSPRAAVELVLASRHESGTTRRRLLRTPSRGARSRAGFERARDPVARPARAVEPRTPGQPQHVVIGELRHRSRR